MWKLVGVRKCRPRLTFEAPVPAIPWKSHLMTDAPALSPHLEIADRLEAAGRRDEAVTLAANGVEEFTETKTSLPGSTSFSTATSIPLQDPSVPR